MRHYGTILLLVVTVASVLGCNREKKEPRSASSATKATSTTPKLTTERVRAFLYQCEVFASKNDAPGFKTCLSSQSRKALDQLLVTDNRRLHRMITKAGVGGSGQAIADQLDVLVKLRLKISWKSQLQRVAKTPRSEVLNVKQNGNRGQFTKQRGTKRTTHFLVFEDRRWRSDLAKQANWLNSLRLRRKKLATEIEKMRTLLKRSPKKNSSPNSPLKH